jgi:serine/threonine-protein kinase RsbW
MSSPTHFALQIPSVMSEGLRVQERICELMEALSYTARDVFAMRLSLEEALTNAIRHGNKLSEEKVVSVDCDVTENRVCVRISDQGDGFDPFCLPDPTQPELIERPGGRGVMLMQTYLNQCEYSDSGRTVTMVRERNSPLPIVPE